MGPFTRFSYRLISIFILTFFIGSTVNAQILTKKQQDSAFLVHPGQERFKKIKKLLTKTFVNFTSNEVSLYGSLSLSKQNINDNAIVAPINYLYNKVSSNNYNTGFSVGLRMDGLYMDKHAYSFILGINRIVVGNYYTQKYTLAPFIEDFTHFKADNVFTTFNIAAHYKQLIPVHDISKHKLYIVFGPSLDYKISNISNENLINGAGNRAIINGDIGTEFDNKGYYVLYAHYKLGVNLISTSLPIQLNRFEMGMSMKLNDLF